MWWVLDSIGASDDVVLFGVDFEFGVCFDFVLLGRIVLLDLGYLRLVWL